MEYFIIGGGDETGCRINDVSPGCERERALNLLTGWFKKKSEYLFIT